MASRAVGKTFPTAGLRAVVANNIVRLRAGFEVRDVECLGQPSNIVAAIAGDTGDDGIGRWMARLLEENGLIANLVEFPAVPRGRSRFRFQVMASHTPEQIDTAVDIFCRCLEEARRISPAAAQGQ